MVRRRFFFSLAALAFLSASSLPAKDRVYNIGEIADTDITSPVRLVVPDVEATDAQKEKEAAKVLVIFRFHPRISEQVEAGFHAAYRGARSNFLAALEQNFHQPTLGSNEIPSAGFDRFLGAFQKQNFLFPVSTNLAALWARGEADETIEAALGTRLRETMRGMIRSDLSPPDIHVGSTLRLVTLADNEATTAQLVEERGNDINKSNFISLPRAKTDLQNSFPPEDRAVGKYLASLVRPNCVLEADLTRELRARRTDGIAIADRYEAGQIIVRRGQLIDKKIFAALHQLNELQQKASASQAQRPAVNDRVVTGPDSPQLRWITAALAGIFLLLILIVWLVSRRRSPASLLPVRVGDGSPLDWSKPPEGSWQERALVAEERVATAQAAARAGLISQLARWWSDKMTRRLMAQRKQLADAHQTAAIEIADLEARLQKIHAPLQDRLRAYEQRIAELEKELTVKGEENRELIKAKLQIARKQLEIEREKNRLEYN